jgi:hypothetical protein
MLKTIKTKLIENTVHQMKKDGYLQEPKKNNSRAKVIKLFLAQYIIEATGSCVNDIDSLLNCIKNKFNLNINSCEDCIDKEPVFYIEDFEEDNSDLSYEFIPYLECCSTKKEIWIPFCGCCSNTIEEPSEWIVYCGCCQ